MSIAWVISIVLVGVAVLFFYVALRAGREVSNATEYYAGTRKLTHLQYDDTYLATNVTFTAVIILLAEYGYQMQWWALAVPIAWIAGMMLVRRVFVGFLLPIFENSWQPRTLHEFCGNRLQSTTLRQVLALVTIIAFVGTAAVEIIGLAYALLAFGIGHRLGLPILVLALTLILVAYARKSGFPGVVATDQLQIWFLCATYIVLIAVGILLVTISFPALSISPGPPTPGVVAGITAIIGFFALFLPFNLCVSDMWQRCYAARWERRTVERIASKKTMALFFVAFLIPIALGLAAAQIGVEHETDGYLLLQVLYNVISGLPMPLSALMGGILFAGFAAGAFSTVDTVLVNAGYIDQYDWRLRSEESDSQESLRATRDSVLIFGVASLLLVGPEFLVPNISLVQIGYAVFSSQIAFAPILLLAVFAIPRVRKGNTKILVGFLVASVVASYGSAIAGGIFDLPDLTNGSPILGLLISSLGVVFYLSYEYFIGER